MSNDLHLTHLTNAFRLAHRASEDGRFSPAARNIFRAVAHEIWKANGKAVAAAEKLAILEVSRG